MKKCYSIFFSCFSTRNYVARAFTFYSAGSCIFLYNNRLSFINLVCVKSTVKKIEVRVSFRIYCQNKTKSIFGLWSRNLIKQQVHSILHHLVAISYGYKNFVSWKWNFWKGSLKMLRSKVRTRANTFCNHYILSNHYYSYVPNV